MSIDNNLLKFLQIVVSLFAAVLFLQSGSNKLLDFSANKNYIKSIFEKTCLNKVSSILFIIITILEVAAGLLSLFGIIFYILDNSILYAKIGLQISIISLLCLFTGQRIAKDYAGAASLMGYSILMILGLFLYGLR